MCLTHSLTSLLSSGGLSKTNWAWNETRKRELFCCSVNIWVKNSPVEGWENQPALDLSLTLSSSPSPEHIHSSLYTFLVCSADHLRLPGWIFFFSFYFTWIIIISFPFLSSHISLLLSLPFLPQTAPVSVGESCMNQQYPALSLPLSPALTVSFTSLVIRGHMWLCILLALPLPL